MTLKEKKDSNNSDTNNDHKTKCSDNGKEDNEIVMVQHNGVAMLEIRIT